MEELAAIVIVLAAVAYFVIRLIVFANATKRKQDRDRDAPEDGGLSSRDAPEDGA